MSREGKLKVVLNHDQSNDSIVIIDKTSIRTRVEESELKTPSTTLDIPVTEIYTTIETTVEKNVKFTTGASTQTTDTPQEVIKVVRKCKPIQNVVFLKTHKTGSSTILNILQRFSENRNLSMVLPSLPEKNHRLGWPYKFQTRYIFEHQANKKYDIFANHARYQRSTIESIMRDPSKTKFVTILRDPLFQLESSAVYLKFDRLFNISKENLVDAFLTKMERNEQEIWNKTRHPKNPAMYLTKNPNAFDLGFRTWSQDHASVMKIIDTVQKDFQLVMISDYMLESLVLLKDELCWDLKDVVYFTLNKRPKRFRQAVNNISDQRKRVKKWNRIDYELFDHFNQTFWQKVKTKGAQFQKDVEKLRDLNKELEDKCIDHGTHYDKSQPWFPILGYKIKADAIGSTYYELCQQMSRSEIDYNNMLREKQSHLNWKKPNKMKKKSGH